MAGAAIMNALITAVRATPSIRVLENYEARDLITRDNQVFGVRLFDRRESNPGILQTLLAKAVILATGGIGQLYAVTTNPAPARGDAIAMAARAGAIIADAEFIQFHPTALNIGKDPAPLATEALRGEGAILVNASGERFMTKIHDDAELAPRDIVSRAVHREITQARGAFLDCRHAIGRNFPEKFPSVYKICTKAGIDPAKDLIPIAPAAHYHMGGVLTDAVGRTSLDGLWACGEAASTGLHGANRLGDSTMMQSSRHAILSPVQFIVKSPRRVVPSSIAAMPLAVIFPRNSRAYIKSALKRELIRQKISSPLLRPPITIWEAC